MVRRGQFQRWNCSSSQPVVEQWHCEVLQRTECQCLRLVILPLGRRRPAHGHRTLRGRVLAVHEELLLAAVALVLVLGVAFEWPRSAHEREWETSPRGENSCSHTLD